MPDLETINAMLLDLTRYAMTTGAHLAVEGNANLEPAMRDLNTRKDAILALIEADRVGELLG